MTTTDQTPAERDASLPGDAAMPTMDEHVHAQQALYQRAVAASLDYVGRDDSETRSPEDTRRLLHELRVHQIELQMQNEELCLAQVKLEEARARYFDLYDLAPVGYCCVSEHGLILEANLTAATLLGVARRDLVAQPITRFIASDDADSYYLHRKQLIKTGTPQEWDLRMVTRDGTPLWAYMHITAAQGEGGAPVHRIVMSDITARKQAEEALRESAVRRLSIIETAMDGFWLVDTQGRLVEVNQTYARMSGYSVEELLSLRIPDLEAAETAADTAEHMQKIMRQGEDRFETKHRRKDGSVFDVEVSVQCRSGKDGTLVCFLRDITVRKRVEGLHLQTQKLESLGTLASGIAHDFNNILSAIRGHVDLAAEDVGPDHAVAPRLESIRKASERASELVRRITAFGRPVEAHRQVVDLRVVVGEALALLRSTLPASISLQTDYAQDAPMVTADAGQVHEAIVNLTTNAVHAIGERAGSITYRLEPVQVDDELARSSSTGLEPGWYARLTVSDSGCGMEAATLARVFDAFYTTKPPDKGTGLGLSMVYGTMRSHGGAVTVQSAPGKGSHFHLYFPATHETVQPQDAAPAPHLPSAGKRVLFVDDEEVLVELSEDVFARMGHQVSGFTDPTVALEAFRAHPQDYDVVITDLSMPHMSGLELARAVLAVRPGMPILMMTGHIRDKDQNDAHLAGIRELVYKPVSLQELGHTIDRLFREGEAGGRGDGEAG
jgi:PAS domain S-box-containing protein